MAFGTPAPGAMSYSSAVPVAQQLQQAAAAAPQANADAAEKMAATKANTEIDKSGQLDAELKQSQTQDAMLNRLAAVPGIEQSPMGQKMLTERFKTLGVPLPKNELGQIDMKAVRAMIAPPIKPWAQWTPAEKSAAAAEDPELRSLPADAPEKARTMAAQTPLTEKGAEFLHAPVAKAEAALAAGHGNTQSLLMAAKSELASLKAKGADTSIVDGILSEDGSSLRPEYMQQKASDLAQAQIDNLHSLGIYRADEAKIKEQAVNNQMTRWDTQSANSKATTSVQSLKMQQQNTQFSQKMQMAQSNLDARLASVQNSSTTNLLKMGQMGVNAYDKQVDHLEKAQNDAESQLRSTMQALNAMRNTTNFDVSDPTFVTMTTTANKLKTTVDTGRATLDSARSMSAQGTAGIFSQITGNNGLAPIININNAAPPGTTYPGGKAQSGQYKSGSSVPDAPGYTFTGKKFPNGDLEAKGPDGKIRPWNPG